LVLSRGPGPYCAVRLISAVRPLAVHPVLAKPDILAMEDVTLVLRLTRHWIHYGFLAHTVLCVLIAAVEGLMGR